MLPGEHVIIVGTEVDALRARAAGLSLRDTILILLPGVTTLAAYLFRAPLEGTIADNVTKHGCGGLNIDGCRVTTTENRARPRGTFPHSDDAWGRGHLERTESHPGGRWPTNLVLVHGQGCKRIGQKKIKGITGTAAGRMAGKDTKVYNQKWAGTQRAGSQCDYVDPEGSETVDAWECQDDCPVPLLDASSGFLAGAGNVRETPIPAGAKNVYAGGWNDDRVRNPNQHGNHGGGASRFYPQFPALRAALEWLDRLVGSRS